MTNELWKGYGIKIGERVFYAPPLDECPTDKARTYAGAVGRVVMLYNRGLIEIGFDDGYVVTAHYSDARLIRTTSRPEQAKPKPFWKRLVKWG